MSVVISSLFRSAHDCCRKAGLSPHTIEHSLGIWGKTEKLPPKRVLEVTTMCGHGMIASNLVESMVEDIKAGRATVQSCSMELAKQCVCGIFNPTRAARLLRAMAFN